MSENRNDKKTVWLYAVILFTSAFIVLLLTAYSQIKFNKNIDEYKNQISSQTKEKINFQTDLKSAVDQNKKLQDEINSMKADLEKYKKAQKENEKKISDLQNEYKRKVSSYQALVEAENEYKSGHVVECAALLYHQCSADSLEGTSLDIYRSIVAQAYPKAAVGLYNEGYGDYRNKNYDRAVEKFQMSLNLESDWYLSDDCYYFMAYAEYKRGNKEAARNALQMLLQKYPRSNYGEDGVELLKQL